MKKILFIINTLNPGGAEKVLVSILNYIDHKKYNIHLCLLFNEGVYFNDLSENINIHFVYNNTKSLHYKLHLAAKKFLKTRLFQKLYIRNKITDKYDTIVSFAEGNALLYHSFIIDKASNNITWIHADLYKNHYTKRIFFNHEEKKCYIQLNKIIYISNNVKNSFIKRFNIQLESDIIYNLIDLNNIRTLSETKLINKIKFTVCSVGSLYKIKAFEKIIYVSNLLKSNNIDIQFWIIGEGSERKTLEKLITDNNLEDTVYLFGYSKNPYPYIKSCDLYINTSLSEGYPLSICEALCLGKPIIATRTLGSEEILENSRYGIITDHNIEDIYNSILQLFYNTEKRNYYSLMAINRAKELFSVDKTISTIESIL